MKRGVKLLILVVLLAAIGIAAMLLLKKSEHDAMFASVEQTTVPETALAQFVDVQKINKIHWMIDSVDYTFCKKDGLWRVEGNDKMPIDMEKFGTILNSACVITASREVDAENVEAYGLDDPTMLIDLWTETNEYHFVLGGMNPTGTGYYASSSNGKYYVIDPMFPEPFGILIFNLCADDTIPKLSNIWACHVEAVDTELMLERTQDADGNDIFTETLSGETVDADAALEAITMFEDHAFESDRITYYAEDDELAEYGLDEPLLTLTVTYGGRTADAEHETFTLYLGKKSHETDKTDFRYARINDSREVYYYPASVLDAYEALTVEGLKTGADQ